MPELTQDDYILAFLEKRGLDYDGRMLDQVWSFNDVQNETTHNFIQWVFPLPQESAGQLSLPIVTTAGVERIPASSDALANLRALEEWFLRFLSRSTVWLTGYNHNHLRIRRMIKSARVIAGAERSATLFQQVISLSGENLGSIRWDALAYWESTCEPLRQN